MGGLIRVTGFIGVGLVVAVAVIVSAVGFPGDRLDTRLRGLAPQLKRVVQQIADVHKLLSRNNVHQLMDNRTSIQREIQTNLPNDMTAIELALKALDSQAEKPELIIDDVEAR